MKRLTTLAMVLAAASALSASAQIAPLDRAKEAAAQSTAASRGTAEQQHAVNMQDSKPAPPPSQAVTGTAMSPTKGGAAKAAPAAKKGKVPTPAEIKALADKQETAGAKKAAPEMAKTAGEKRRDPFVSPIVRAVSTGPSQTCSGGKHCLAPDDITVRGIVKSQNGWIAVVENSAKRTFFLHEKDEIFNAVIVKITQDSLVIREQSFDNLGKQVTHEVVKRLPA
jgi:hypothetical protein